MTALRPVTSCSMTNRKREDRALKECLSFWDVYTDTYVIDLQTTLFDANITRVCQLVWSYKFYKKLSGYQFEFFLFGNSLNQQNTCIYLEYRQSSQCQSPESTRTRAHVTRIIKHFIIESSNELTMTKSPPFSPSEQTNWRRRTTAWPLYP